VAGSAVDDHLHGLGGVFIDLFGDARKEGVERSVQRHHTEQHVSTGLGDSHELVDGTIGFVEDPAQGAPIADDSVERGVVEPGEVDHVGDHARLHTMLEPRLLKMARVQVELPLRDIRHGDPRSEASEFHGEAPRGGTDVEDVIVGVDESLEVVPMDVERYTSGRCRLVAVPLGLAVLVEMQGDQIGVVGWPAHPGDDIEKVRSVRTGSSASRPGSPS